MLKIHVLTLGDYQTNCYIIHEERSSTCCVIDPGYDPSRILAYLEKAGLQMEAVLLTHGHFDHVGAVKALAMETDCTVYLCEPELSLPPMMTAGPLFYTHTYAEGDVLSLAGLQIRVMQTPGHTPGSVCLLVADAMFSGDTLFAGSMGRCDFPGSSIFDMRKSLKKLYNLAGDYRVFPGHAEATTLEYERKTNPYLR